MSLKKEYGVDSLAGFACSRSPNEDIYMVQKMWALTPLVVFLLSYLVVSIIAGDFYKMPITVAFVVSSVVAIAISKGGKLSNRIEQFCRGAANSNIMLMVLIFILAGAFAQTSAHKLQAAV